MGIVRENENEKKLRHFATAVFDLNLFEEEDVKKEFVDYINKCFEENMMTQPPFVTKTRMTKDGKYYTFIYMNEEDL